MKYTLLLLFSVLLTHSNAFAKLHSPTAQNYQSGVELCAAQANLIAHEKGRYIAVPLDYANPSRGELLIYSFFQGGKFDPNKPTVAYFIGGPGQTSHWGFLDDFKSYNVLMMDQRGIACSRHLKYSEYRNPEFYSSEATARDLEILRKAWGLGSISVFGISYGTMPATIYASLFPQNTTALVLEGTVGTGSPESWVSTELKNILQNIVDQWTTEARAAFAVVASKEALSGDWFGIWLKDELLFNGGGETALSKMNAITTKTAPAFFQNLKDYYGTEYDHPRNDLFVVNDVPYYMLSCQEMSLADPKFANSYVLVRNQIEIRPTPSFIQFRKNCVELGALTVRSYESRNYPVTVPVTYFQGEMDPATPLHLALRHFKAVPQGFAQFLILKNGGHNPNMQEIRNGDTLQLQNFEAALRGDAIKVSGDWISVP